MSQETSTGKGKISSDVMIGIVLIVLSIAVFIGAGRFPEAARRLPMLSAVLLIVLSVILIVRSFLRTAADKKTGSTEPVLFPWKTTKYALITFALTGLYIFLMEHVDFFIATVLFVPAMMIFMRVKKKAVIILCTAGITLFCWFMFVNQLHIRMP